MTSNPTTSMHPAHIDGRHAEAVDVCIRGRRSTRAFTGQAVSRRVVEEILRVASAAPSNSNTQPWRVHVVAGSAKLKLSAAILAAHASNSAPPLAHFPDPLPEAFAARQNVFGTRYYQSLGINRNDAEARARQTTRNFSFFDAPVGLIFTIECVFGPHSWLDCGIFIQSVMIAATARGLATCPQAAFARYQAAITEHLELGDGHAVLCGMSLGYADHAAAVNQFGMPREPLESFATLSGFDD